MIKGFTFCLAANSSCVSVCFCMHLWACKCFMLTYLSVRPWFDHRFVCLCFCHPDADTAGLGCVCLFCVWSQINAVYHRSCVHTFHYRIWTWEHNTNYCQAAGIITPLLHSCPCKPFSLHSYFPSPFLVIHFFPSASSFLIFSSFVCHSSP